MRGFMENWTSKENLKRALKAATSEIERLRRHNKSMGIELGAYNRLMSVLERTHSPQQLLSENGENIVWKLEKTIEALDKEPTKENG